MNIAVTIASFGAAVLIPFLFWTVHRALVRVQAIQETVMKHLTDHEVAKVIRAFGPDADDFERDTVDTSKWSMPDANGRIPTTRDQ